MVCLDSDFIINALRNKRDAGRKLVQIKQEGEPLFTTAINTFELFKGLKENKREKEIETLNDFLFGVDILDFDFESSEKAAQIFNTLKEQGNLIDIADILIASIAISNNQPLLTENKKHFDRIKELVLQDF